VARELLANVAKHAGAGRVRIDITTSAEALELCVADDGRGMPEGALSSALGRGNIGLATVRERVEALGGAVSVGRGLGALGTGVHIRLPI
jgi:two-component system NarL family sensor kinase